MTTTADAPATDEMHETPEAPVATIGHGPYRLSPEQLEEFGSELDAIRQRVIADLGQADADYIRGIVKAQRAFEGAGRALFYLPPAWPLAVGALSVSKILDNMEIGHNVMHGQYDWMGDPGLNSRMYEWDTVCPSEQWKYSHNYIHHTYTNILGRDRDIGYGILRMDEDQPWKPYYLGNPLYALGLMTFFQWGVLLHDLEVENIVLGQAQLEGHQAPPPRHDPQDPQPDAEGLPVVPRAERAAVPADAGRQRHGQPDPQHLDLQHHLLRPLPGRRGELLDRGDRGRDPRRLVLPAAARLGEHHRRQALPHPDREPLVPDRAPPVPDIPARRYPEIAPEIEALCEKYDLDYNTGPLHKQLGSVAAKILKYAVPPRPSRQQLASVTPLRFFTRSGAPADSSVDQSADSGAPRVAV